ncbi:TetR family transcriptional regulator [Kribbella solani]|uniref:TetR family transcriptional regulator n=1 Tax=Kribbella solani TaxID=236067 RepID=UPI0029A71594|nr:TetR family transcriptional regulator [Kribbella solani]MDX2967708.1 TetR family transcriptional regulator [Kribbella solani]MDX3001134.1 TetR family transcriptional regulator [Kribbella solani]
MAQQGGLRERKKRETRAALAEAALRLALEKGPDQVTVEEIAEAADVSVRTFFNYFPHKEHAILGRNPEHVDRALERVLNAPASESPLTTMWFIVQDVLRDFEEDGEMTRRGELIMSTPDLLYHLLHASIEDEQLLTKALTERMGEPPGSLRPALIVNSAGTACRMAMELHKTVPGRPVRELLTEAFQLLAQGIDTAFGPDDQKGRS